jgi:hypothetical protein
MGPIEDLEIKRRSLAMLSPGASSGMSREDGMRLIENLQQAQRRIVELERDLHAAVVCQPPSDETPPSASRR